MNTKTVLTIVLVPLLIGGLVWALLEKRKAREPEPEHPEHSAAPSHVKRGLAGEPILTLDAETQKRIGLKVESPASAQWQPEVKGYGRVLDPAPLVSLMAELMAAHVASENSQREFDRLRTLAEQNNASARALQAAEAAAKRDQVLVESLRSKLVLGWGKALWQRNDPPAFAGSLANGENALVRIDLPAGDSLKSLPTVARLTVLADEEPPIAAEFFGAAPSVDPQSQGQGFLFLVKGDSLPPGAAVTGYLKVGGEPLTGVLAPRSALVRHAGRAWIYVRTGDTEFTRREIPLDRPLDNGWFVPATAGLKEPVVVVGAQQLLSEELKSLIKEAE